jgi:hypothetical protein
MKVLSDRSFTLIYLLQIYNSIVNSTVVLDSSATDISLVGNFIYSGLTPEDYTDFCFYQELESIINYQPTFESNVSKNSEYNYFHKFSVLILINMNINRKIFMPS